MEEHNGQAQGLARRWFVGVVVAMLALAVPQAPAKLWVVRENPREIHEEQDPNSEQACASMGELDIAYQIGLGKMPSLGLRVTDPRGRRFGYDPTSGEGWEELPLAEGFVNCDENDEETGPANCTAHIQICGPISGAYKLEVFPARPGKYSVSVTAASERAVRVRPTDSWVHETGDIEMQSPKMLMLQYSRVPGSDIEFLEPAQASGDAWTGLHPSAP